MSALEQHMYPWLAVGGLVCAAAVFVTLFFVTAPYGRHTRKGWGPRINARVGWVVMESPSVVLFFLWFVFGHGFQGGVVWVFVALWEAHYIHRTYLFPFRMRGKGKQMPLFIPLSAIVFNLYNSYLNGRYLGAYGGQYTAAWLTDPRFLIGVALFVAGLGINLHADKVLFSLRKPGETGYKIPRGGLYRWISCPNYFGELVEWAGWAVATWSLPGLVFAVWTAANLVPRALSHHRWYHGQFEDYPAERKAVIPFVL